MAKYTPKFVTPGGGSIWSVKYFLPVKYLNMNINIRLIYQAAQLIISSENLTRDIQELSENIKISEEMTSAMMSGVCWILRGGASNDLDSETLHSELLQLGTPREHVGAISRVYKTQANALMTAMRKESMRLSRLQHVDCEVIALANPDHGQKPEQQWQTSAQISLKINSGNKITTR